MANEVKELKIKVSQVKDCTTKDGRKFKAYRCVGSNGDTMDLKFTRDCHNVPTERCWILVDSDKVNVSRRGEYPVTWVKDINRVEPLGTGKTNAADYFDAADSTEIPF